MVSYYYMDVKRANHAMLKLINDNRNGIEFDKLYLMVTNGFGLRRKFVDEQLHSLRRLKYVQVYSKMVPDEKGQLYSVKFARPIVNLESCYDVEPLRDRRLKKKSVEVQA